MKMRTQLVLLFGAVICVAASTSGIHESIFNNFLVDTFRITADARGQLEFPRELQGLLVVVMAGALALLPVTRMGAIGAGVLALGMTGMAFWGTSWYPMMAMMIIGSAGMHLLHPIGASIAIGLGKESSRGIRMGWMGSLGGIGTILGAGFVWLFFDKADPQYRVGFLCAAACAGVGAVVYGLMHVPDLHQRRARLVWEKKFRLYYWLELFFGARKQIFITFGPWVLIKVYGEPATAIAGLFLIAAAIGIFFKPLAGLAIDRLGERWVLTIDGMVLAVVCLGYGYALEIMGGDMERARILACACFVIDNLLFSLGSGRAIYASRLADSPQELTSTLAMGVSVNHIASMTIPSLAGALWMAQDHRAVFLAAAVMALVISGISSLVPGKKA